MLFTKDNLKRKLFSRIYELKSLILVYVKVLYGVDTRRQMLMGILETWCGLAGDLTRCVF